MRRRTFLATLGVVGTGAGTAGCLGGVGANDRHPDVVLPEPDREFDSSELPYPAWGQRVPAETVPAALSSQRVSFRTVDEPSLITFFYSHCQTICPVLISTLRNVRAHARNNGYAGDVSFLPVTFDPARDTAQRLRTYAEEMNVAADGDGWRFLRPQSGERATEVVQAAFGVHFERTEPEEMDKYMFSHASMTLLVNGDGFVERAYRTKSPDEDQIVEDLTAVRTA